MLGIATYSNLAFISQLLIRPANVRAFTPAQAGTQLVHLIVSEGNPFGVLDSRLHGNCSVPGPGQLRPFVTASPSGKGSEPAARLLFQYMLIY